MAEYKRAYHDSFQIGFGAAVMNFLWILTTDSFVPLIIGGLLVVVVLFVLPILLVALHADTPIGEIESPHQ